MFVSSEIVKWNVKSLEVVDRVPTYYSIGHLCVPGGDSKQPWGKYVIAYNKITKDRYLPTGPELTQSAQLFSIDGDKMELLLDFPTTGEPHYAQAVPAELIKDKSTRFFKIEDNKHPYATKGEKEARGARRQISQATRRGSADPKQREIGQQQEGQHHVVDDRRRRMDQHRSPQEHGAEDRRDREAQQRRPGHGQRYQVGADQADAVEPDRDRRRGAEPALREHFQRREPGRDRGLQRHKERP